MCDLGAPLAIELINYARTTVNLAVRPSLEFTEIG